MTDGVLPADAGESAETTAGPSAQIDWLAAQAADEVELASPTT